MSKWTREEVARDRAMVSRPASEILFDDKFIRDIFWFQLIIYAMTFAAYNPSCCPLNSTLRFTQRT